MKLDQFELTTRGFSVCPTITGTFAGVEFISVAYRSLSSVLAKWNCEEEYGDNCNCLHFRYMPKCELLMDIGGFTKSLITEPRYLNSYKSMDSDGDQKVSFDEFRSARQIMMSSTNEDEAEYNSMDIDNDGSVSFAEYHYTAEQNNGKTSHRFKPWEVAVIIIGVIFGVLLLVFITYKISQRENSSQFVAFLTPKKTPFRNRSPIVVKLAGEYEPPAV